MLRIFGFLEHVEPWVWLAVALVGFGLFVFSVTKAVVYFSTRRPSKYPIVDARYRGDVVDIKDTLAPAPEREEIWDEPRQGEAS